jgi:hypothetical protein
MQIPVATIPSLPAKAAHAASGRPASAEFVSIMAESAEVAGTETLPHASETDQAAHQSFPVVEDDHATNLDPAPRGGDPLPLRPDMPIPLTLAASGHPTPDPAEVEEGMALRSRTVSLTMPASVQSDLRSPAPPTPLGEASEQVVRHWIDLPHWNPPSHEVSKNESNMAQIAGRDMARGAEQTSTSPVVPRPVSPDHPSIPHAVLVSPWDPEVVAATPRADVASPPLQPRSSPTSPIPPRTAPLAESRMPMASYAPQFDQAAAQPRGDGHGAASDSRFTAEKAQNNPQAHPPLAPPPPQEGENPRAQPPTGDLPQRVPAGNLPSSPAPTNIWQAAPWPSASPAHTDGSTAPQPPAYGQSNETAQSAPVLTLPPPETKDSPARAATLSVLTAVVAEAQRLAVQTPHSPVVLTLAPEELGTLCFLVRETEQGLHLHLTVDQPATLDLLRRQGDQILSELRQSGFQNASFSFAGNDGQQGRNPQEDLSSSIAPPPDPRPHSPSKQSLILQKEGSLLNLRL